MTTIDQKLPNNNNALVCAKEPIMHQYNSFQNQKEISPSGAGVHTTPSIPTFQIHAINRT